MFSLRPKARPPRDALLAAIVIRNAGIRETRHGDHLRLTAPLTRTGLRKLLGGRPEKTFELDSLGQFVWQGLDGSRTVEEIIRRFAKEKRTNLREAEVAVLAFLKTLAQRNLIALLAPATKK